MPSPPHRQLVQLVMRRGRRWEDDGPLGLFETLASIKKNMSADT